METVTLKLPHDLLKGAARVASGQDVTIGHLVRQLLAREVARRLDPKTPNRADEGLLAALQALLARDMADARDWDDLAARLSRHGYELRPAGGGVALFKTSCGTRVCKGSELGFAYRRLVRRFQAGMPGHPHGALGESFAVYRPDSKPLREAERDTLHREITPLFSAAEDWEGLIANLADRRLYLRAHGSGLAIYKAPQGRMLCNTAAVGHRYRALVRRFGGPMPGHPHGKDGNRTQGEEVQEFDVIERDG